MKNLMIAAMLLPAVGLATAQSVQAQATASGSATATASASGTANAAAFSCGGVGQEDQARMKAEAAKHDLLVTFSATGGAYLADIDVEIRKGGQVVLQGRCGGPLMLVDLAPQGSYEIRATSGGKTQKKTVNVVDGKPGNVSFVW